MHRLGNFVVVAALAAGMVGAVLAPRAAEGVTKDYIVVLRRDAVAAASVSTAAAELGREHGLEVTNVYGVVLRGFAARIPDAKLDRVRRDPRVAAVEPDRPVAAFVERVPTGVDRIGADTVAEGEPPPPTQAGEPVAVIDTGIARHPDLNIAGGHNCTSREREEWADDNGHGTHVAGIIGAKNDGVGVVGVAPDTPLYAVKVLDRWGSGRWSWIICGLDWTAQQGITVANMSLGGSFPGDDRDICESSALHIAVCDAADRGVRIVVAAGNSGSDADRFVPAKYDQVTAVSALADADGCAGRHGRPTRDGADDTLATFSSDGAVVDVAAPGVDILSTVPTGNQPLAKRSGYRKLSGTSMAAPHVAAAIALGWDGTKEPGPIPGDDDGFDEGIVNLSGHTACTEDGGGT